MTNSYDDNVSSFLEFYLKLLKSGRDVFVSELVPAYKKMDPILHHLASSPKIDLKALNYSLPRLPEDIFSVSKVLLVESYQDIKSVGFDITDWQKTTSQSRRRLTYINPNRNTIACLMSSESDLHDLINCLVSFHIERQKIKDLLAGSNQPVTDDSYRQLGLNSSQWQFLKEILGPDWKGKLNSTLSDFDPVIRTYGHLEPLYKNNAKRWLNNLTAHLPVLNIKSTPVYFVSSNSHSLVNIIGGYLNTKQNYIFDYINRINPDLYNQWFENKTKNNTPRINDFLYYVANHFLKDNPDFIIDKREYEKSLGIITIPSIDNFQSNTQIIPLSSLAVSANLDSNIHIKDKHLFAASRSYIVNFEYPLGLAAYYLLKEIFNEFLNLQSVYIMGKSAIINGNIGDILIPNYVYEEKTKNSFLIKNIFNHNFNYQNFISNVFFDQKAASVFGTYLENAQTITNYQQQGINIIEMESGPYLSAIAEKYLLAGNEIAPDFQYDLTGIPFDFGIINYASDNPLIQTLAEESESFRGIEPIYLATLATLQQIIDKEEAQLSS